MRNWPNDMNAFLITSRRSSINCIRCGTFHQAIFGGHSASATTSGKLSCQFSQPRRASGSSSLGAAWMLLRPIARSGGCLIAGRCVLDHDRSGSRTRRCIRIRIDLYHLTVLFFRIQDQRPNYVTCICMCFAYSIWKRCHTGRR